MTPEYIIKLAEQEKLKGNHSPTLREAAELALTAMEEAVEYAKYIRADHYMRPYAIQTLREALADQSEQTHEMVEPIAYISGYVQGHPVIKTVDETVLLPVGTSFYTAPPQRKPLTNEQIKPIFEQWKILYGDYTIDLIRAIERAHGIGEKE